MLIYNITTKVNHEVLTEWLKWQTEIHIPDIMATGLFYEHRFYQLLEHDEEEGKTFVTQFLTHSRSDYQKYIELFAPGLRDKASGKWGQQVISFRTLLQNLK